MSFTAFDCVRTLSMPLPEDILKRKWGGDISGAIRAIDLRLQQDIPDRLRMRLTAEREMLLRLPTQYPYTYPQAIEKLQELLPGITQEQFDQLELEGLIDFLYISGEKKYFIRALRSVAKTPRALGMVGKKPDPVNPYLDAMIQTIREKGSLTRKITLSHKLEITDDAFVPGDYRIWLPFPIPCAQQRDVQLISGDPDLIAPETAPARTAFWEGYYDQKPSPCITYSYVGQIRYADPMHADAPAAPLYPNARPVCDEDLAEDGTHIRFTPYLRSLAASITAGADTPLQKAWRCYEFVTTKVGYSFMRDYFQIDNIGEYCAVNLKGDCGLMALTFIILCRICGVPARWQSGMSIDEDSVGSHDWAQFYLDGWGWLFADPSYGGSAFRAGNAVRHAFYFGNLDPMRLAANRVFMADLTPPMNAFRIDPYDNQSGEIERVGAETAFTGRQVDDAPVLLAAEDL